MKKYGIMPVGLHDCTLIHDVNAVLKENLGLVPEMPW